MWNGKIDVPECWEKKEPIRRMENNCHCCSGCIYYCDESPNICHKRKYTQLVVDGHKLKLVGIPMVTYADEMAPDKECAILIYGASGVGKTKLIETCCKPLVFNNENGLKTIAGKRTIHGDRIAIENVKSFADIMNYCQKMETTGEINNYETICIDSLTRIADTMLVELKSRMKEPRQAYMMVQEAVIGFLTNIKIKKNIYIICGQDTIKDETTGGLMFGPAMPGQKLGPMLGYYFDYFMALQTFEDPVTKVTHRALRTVRNNQYEAKVRTDKLNYWEPADLTALFNKIRS